MVKVDTARKIPLQHSCIEVLTPGLPCPEAVEFVVENRWNKVAVECCRDHLAQVTQGLDPDNLKIWPLEQWVNAHKEEPHV
jgi:hypothetical protein